MKYARTTVFNGMELIVTTLPLSRVPQWDSENPLPGTYLVADDVEKGWIKDGGTFIPPPPPEPPTLDEIQKQYTDAVQARLDSFAQTRGYDGILSACTYTASAVPQFRAEGEYAVHARDTTWAACYTVLGEVLAGQRPLPTLDELFGLLPTLEWPQ